MAACFLFGSRADWHTFIFLFFSLPCFFPFWFFGEGEAGVFLFVQVFPMRLGLVSSLALPVRMDLWEGGSEWDGFSSTSPFFSPSPFWSFSLWGVSWSGFLLVRLTYCGFFPAVSLFFLPFFVFVSHEAQLGSSAVLGSWCTDSREWCKARGRVSAARARAWSNGLFLFCFRS